jgi:hypothetical protein
MKLVFEGQEIQKSIELDKAIKQFDAVKYGLKHYIWKMRNRSAITKRYKDTGLFDKFVIAKGKRLKDGSYSRDEVDWSAYNLGVWEEYSTDFEAQAGLPEDAKTIKQIGEKKRELIMYFLENYVEGVDLKIDRTPLIGTISTDEGITISHKKGVFTVKSPSGTVSIIIQKGQPMEMVNHKADNANIKFPERAVETFREMLRIAELISKNPQETLDSPYLYLKVDTKIAMKVYSAQEFLIKENDEHMAEMNARNESKKEKQLTHENHAKKQVTVNVSKKAETIDEIKADAQAYKWKNFTIINGNHYYGVRAMAYLEWLTVEEISAKQHKFFLDDEKITDIAFDEITQIDTEYTSISIDKKDTTLLWIPEEDFQPFFDSLR